MNTAFTGAIAANITALSEVLYEAGQRATEASNAIRLGKRNEAIGGIMGLDEILATAQALHGAAIALHRQ